MGTDGNTGPKLEGWIRDAGFVNIKQHIAKLPMGGWPKNKVLKEVGILNVEQALMGLEGLVLRLFTQALGWSIPEVEVFLVGLRKDIKNPNIHAYYNL